MSVRTFWLILIKLLGLWLVFNSVIVIPQFFSTLFFMPTEAPEAMMWTLFLLLITIGLFIGILRLFVFRSSWLIDKFHLDRGFKEKQLSFNIKTFTILRIAIIVLGGLIFIDSLPAFCRQIFSFLQQRHMFIQYPDSGWLIFNFVQTVLGYLLMTNSKPVASYIVRHSEDSTRAVRKRSAGRGRSELRGRQKFGMTITDKRIR